MAAFNFPNSPSVNDLHTENGVTFKWNGTIWLRVGNSYSDISTLNVSGISTLTGGVNVGTAGTISSVGNLTFDKPGAGIITATKYYGDGSTLSNITSTTINNNANNRVITGSGTANTLEAETSLEWDGTDTLKVVHGSSYPDFRVKHSAGGGTFESFRCGNGPFRIGNTTQSFYSAADDLAIGGGSGDKGITIYSGSSDSGVIAFADGTSDPAYRMGQIIYGHSDNSMTFRTNGNTERLRIDSSGNLSLGTTTSIQKFTIDGGGISLDNGWNTQWGVNASRAYIQGEDANGNNRLLLGTNNGERLRIDSSGRVLIGGGSSPAQVGDGQLIVYSSDRLHPAIKCAGQTNNYGNGHTLIGDNYQTDESQVNLGVSYSSSALVLSRCCKVSGSSDNTYLSSQDTYSTRPSALRLTSDGAFSFHTTETNATVATDSAVTLTEVFSIDRVGNIRQKISNRYMYFGANQELQVGVSGSDPYINSASGDLKIADAGNPITVVRSDGFQMYQDIYFATAGKGIVLGATSNVDSNTLDDYEEGTFTPVFNGSDGGGTSRSGTGKYTKVGNLVNCWVDLSNANGSGFGSGYMRVSGLPFTCTQQSWTTNIWTYNVAFNTSRLQNFHMPSSSTYCNGYYSVNDSTWQPWYVSEWDATQIYCRFQLTYLAS